MLDQGYDPPLMCHPALFAIANLVFDWITGAAKARQAHWPPPRMNALSQLVLMHSASFPDRQGDAEALR